MQNPEIKQWKESCRLQSKKLSTLEKQFSKMLPFNMTTQLRVPIQTWLDDQLHKSNSRYKEEADMFNKLSTIRGGVNQLRETLRAYEKKENYIMKIQNISEGIIGNMQSFKGDMAKEYERYAAVEEGLVRELEMMQIKVGQYEKGEVVHEEPINKHKPVQKQKIKAQQEKQPIKLQTKPNDNEGIQKALVRIQDQMRQLTKDVEGIDLDMRSLGKNLGWPEEDHNDFILLWNRRKDNDSFKFEQECFAQLKTYTMDQIRGHFQKHQKNLILQEKRKQLLYEYKLKKEKKRELELDMIERKQKQEKQQINKIKKEAERAKQEKQTKEKLQYWKLMKEAEKQAFEKEKEIEEQRRKLQIAERKKRVEEKKVVVNQWKQEKEVEKEKETQRIERKRPQSAVNKETLERIKKKEDELLMKKMDILRAKEQKQADKLQKQQLLKQKKFVQYNYVKSKLDEQTAAIKEKQRTKFDGSNPKDAETFGGNLGIVHVRAVPSWRQGI